ncbi:hypothetical protein DACRYDRAFT_103443, partial [Dacryopinax primogenitus]
IPHKSLDLVFSTLGTPGQWTAHLATQRPTPTLIEITTVTNATGLEANWGTKFPWYARLLIDFAAWYLHPRVPKGVKFVAHNTAFLPQDLAAMVKEAEEGRLNPLIGTEFTLEQGAEAFDLAHKGIIGKVIFRISD